MKAPNYKRTVFATYSSTVTQAVTVNLAPILFLIFQNSYGLSDEQVGRLILLNFGTQIVADIWRRNLPTGSATGSLSLRRMCSAWRGCSR